MTGQRARVGMPLGLVLVAAGLVGCASAAPAAPAAVVTPYATQGTTASGQGATAPPAPSGPPQTAPGSSPSAPAGASPSSQIVPSAPASIVDPICDPYLTAAEVASVSGTVAFIQGSHRPGLENTQAIDVLCAYSIEVNGTAELAWQISKVGKKTIADDLDGPVLADLLAIAKLVRTPA